MKPNAGIWSKAMWYRVSHAADEGEISPSSQDGSLRGVSRRIMVVVIPIVVLAFVTGWPAIASAHSGEIEVEGEVGPYFVEIADEALPNDTFLYMLTIREVRGGSVVDDAVITVRASSEAETFGPQAASPLPDSYQLVLPFSNPEDWRVEVSIAHDEFERISFSHGLRAPGTPWWRSPLLLLAAGVVTVIVMSESTRSLRARRRRAAIRRSSPT